MSRNTLIVVAVMVVVGLISAVLTYIRTGNMSPLADIQSKGLAFVQRGNLLFFGVLTPLLVGVIAFFLYRSMLGRSPASAHTSFLLLAVGLGVVLTVLAAVVFRMRGFTEFTALHVLYIVGFSWDMPMLWTA